MTDNAATPGIRQGNTAFANSLAILAIRLVLGLVFFYAGSQKLFGWFTEDGKPMVAMLAGGLPGPAIVATILAYIAAIAEFGCGILVFLGLLSRVATIPIIITMCVAIALFTGPNGFGGTYKMVTLNTGDPAMILNMGYAYNLALIAMAAAVLIAGPGLVSADAFLFRRNVFGYGPQPLDSPGKKTT